MLFQFNCFQSTARCSIILKLFEIVPVLLLLLTHLFDWTGANFKQVFVNVFVFERSYCAVSGTGLHFGKSNWVRHEVHNQFCNVADKERANVFWRQWSLATALSRPKVRSYKNTFANFCSAKCATDFCWRQCKVRCWVKCAQLLDVEKHSGWNVIRRQVRSSQNWQKKK